MADFWDGGLCGPIDVDRHFRELLPPSSGRNISDDCHLHAVRNVVVKFL